MTATTTYRLPGEASLVLRVNDGSWQTFTFEPGEATGEELAEAVDGLDGITGSVDAEGRLVLATVETGETTVLEVDVRASTAAVALGLATAIASATGSGPGSARLTSLRTAPYALPANATMTIQVDGKSRKVSFGEDERPDWTAEDVAAHVNRVLRRKVASVTGDGHVRLISPSQGVGSSLAVTAPADDDLPDAAAVLGFEAGQATSEPYRTEPAALTCRPAPEDAENTVVENLTSAPIELQLPTGRCVLPARGRLVVAREIAADSLLLRLGAQGTVRMSPERTS
ncbi:hypothetical protein [Flindersiella endophytica]